MNLNYEPTYKIKPLEWHEINSNHGFPTFWIFKSIIGIFCVYEKCWVNDDLRSRYDPDVISRETCNSFEDGKQKVEKFYLKYLKESLIEL